jgi:hypothetical protein
MAIVARLDQYSATLAQEFDEVTYNKIGVTNTGSYFSYEFSENVGISTKITANKFKPYDLINDEFAGTLYGVGLGTYMSQRTDNSVIVYDEIDEITLYGYIVKQGLTLNLDAGDIGSYSGSGTTWNDLSTSKNSANLVSNPAYTKENLGGLIFTGTEYASLSSIPFSSSTNFTISAIVNTSNISGIETIFDFRQSSNSGVQFFIGGSGRFNFKINANTYTFSNILSTSNIYFLDATYDGSRIKMFINGVNVLSQSIITSIPITGFNPTIATVNYTTGTTYFTGTIYSIKCYNRTLSQEEINQNFNTLRYRYSL